MRTHPSFREIQLKQLTTRARVAWRTRSDTQDVLMHAISHAYVLLALAVGDELDHSLPVVEFANPSSIDTAAKLEGASLADSIRAALSHVNAAHRFAMEVDRLAEEYVEATAAHLDLLRVTPKGAACQGGRAVRRDAVRNGGSK